MLYCASNDHGTVAVQPLRSVDIVPSVSGKSHHGAECNRPGDFYCKWILPRESPFSLYNTEDYLAPEGLFRRVNILRHSRRYFSCWCPVFYDGVPRLVCFWWESTAGPLLDAQHLDDSITHSPFFIR